MSEEVVVFDGVEVGARDRKFADGFLTDACVTDMRCDATLDVVCRAQELPFGGAVFDYVIMCNPFGYGFRDEEQADALLSSVDRVLAPDGKLIIVGHTNNPYCSETKVRKCAARHGYAVEIVAIDARRMYAAHEFHTNDGRPTQPNRKITLHRPHAVSTGNVTGPGSQ